jgi:hypothetical protein
MPDLINHPPHYTAHPSGIECIQITEHMGFNLGNALKYIWRADLKGNPDDDLAKAIWYINREIKRRKETIKAVEFNFQPIGAVNSVGKRQQVNQNV